MEVTIYSAFVSVALTLIRERFDGFKIKKEVLASAIFTLPDDTQIYEMNQWLGDAIGCGLISGGNVERR